MVNVLRGSPTPRVILDLAQYCGIRTCLRQALHQNASLIKFARAQDRIRNVGVQRGMVALQGCKEYIESSPAEGLQWSSLVTD